MGNHGSSGSWGSVIGTTSTVAGYAGAAADITKEVATGAKVLKTAKIVGYGALPIGIASDYYLANHIDPATGQPYLSQDRFLEIQVYQLVLL